MLDRERIELQWHGREDALRNAQEVRDTLAQYPNGLIPPQNGG
jgi:hypothetical protein